MGDVIDVFWGCNGTICDCCGALNQDIEVFTLDRGCAISLCRVCIQDFQAFLIPNPKVPPIISLEKSRSRKEKT